MPEDSKKDHQKGKHDSKEQRKPRRRNQAPPTEKKTEKKEDAKVPDKPVYEPPPPEFYKNLKRETDEILKISEEANSKYKKKEILSNWSKYEMPIETYDKIEEQENMGADYEVLVETPLSIGGHFQFKHEKSWDITSAPSLYDKYFDINMDSLATALCTIPFYERNNLDKDIFSEIDLLNMNNRSTKFKQKYYNDKSYATPEMEAQDKILSKLKDNPNDIEQPTIKENTVAFDIPLAKSIENTENDIDSSIQLDTKFPVDASPKSHTENTNITLNIKDDDNDDIDDLIMGNVIDIQKDVLPVETVVEKRANLDNLHSDEKLTTTETTSKSETPDEAKNPVIESPEDLEKWLDDFLDG